MTSIVSAIRLAEPQPFDGGDPADHRVLELAIAVAALPVLALVAAVLSVLNRRHNPGPLFYTQWRMGQHRRAFRIVKFRSMRPDPAARAFDEPEESHRITALGAFIRRHRVDELPQILNVLRGEMSIIGPRPDALDHAEVFCAVVPGYASRHVVRPGITGLAQVTLGYAVGLAGTADKVRLDHQYIRARSVLLDLRILLTTGWMVLRGRCPAPGSLFDPRPAATPNARDTGELCPWLS